MKWVGIALLVLGGAALLEGARGRGRVHRERAEWSEAWAHIERFEERIPVADIMRNSTVDERVIPFRLTIQDDRYWQHVAKRLNPEFAVLGIGARIVNSGSIPDLPLGLVEARVSVNGVDRPLRIDHVRYVWGYTTPVQLGDQIDGLLKIKAESAPETISAVLLKVIFRGDKEDHPDFGWSISEDLSEFVQWWGVAFSVVGLFFLILAWSGRGATSPQTGSEPRS